MKKPRKPKPWKLTPKRQRFVEEYVVDLNATQAAIRAGFSPKTANREGTRLLSNAVVAGLIENLKAERTAKTGITQERVLSELELLAFSDLTHYDVNPETGKVEPTADAPPGVMRALQSIKFKTRRFGEDGENVEHEAEIKLWDKPGPLKLAGRHVGLFPDRMEHTGKGGKPIEVAHKVVAYIPENGRKKTT